MRGRRYRLYTICAVVAVFLLYRTLENSWALSNGADSLENVDLGGSSSSSSNPPLGDPAQPPPPPPPPPPPAGSDSDKLDSPEDDPPKKVTAGGGLLGDEQDIERELELDSKKQDSKQKTEGEDTYDGGYKGSKDSSKGSSKDTYSDSTKDTYKDSYGSSSDYSGKDSSKDTSKDSSKDSSNDKTSPDAPKVHWSDPPSDDHQLDHSAEDKEWAANHWTKPKENYPLPVASIASIPSGTPKKIPKIQAEFGTETERVKNKRLYRQGRVKGELERAWSGYRKFAWMHDELLPESNGAKDPFCGWAATLVDSLDTLWIADMRDEFDAAANAVAKIDFTFTTRSDIPVFETTIRYLGGLIAAYDVSGGAKGKYPVLLKKAVELAEVLMGIFDTPNRMPLLYYHWRPPYSSEPHRAGQVGIAELATLSMEFTRLAQLTDTAKYYDAINRITDALVKMQKDGETDVPGLFPEKIDASGCNRTAVNPKSGLSKAAQQQFEDDDLDTEPEGYKAESGNNKLSRRAAIPPPGPDAEDDEDTKRRDWLNTAGPALSKELEDEEARNNGRTPPMGADGSKTEWECVDQGLIPAQWGSGMYHVGGSQDSAYEYFPKQYLLLGGLESKYQKLHEDAVDAIDKHLLFRPMIKNTGDWDILFPAKLTKTGLEKPKFSTSHEIAHLTCFIGGMYGLGGKIFDRPEDVERAKQLTDGCVWAYQATTTGLMPESAHLADCPTLDKCKFNQTYWYELLDPSKDWREKEMAKWEDAEAERAQAAKNREKLREQAREKAAAQDDATDQDGADYSKYSETKSSSSKSKYGSSDEKSYGKSTTDEEDAYDYKTSKDKSDYSDSSYKTSKDKSDDSDSSYKSSKDDSYKSGSGSATYKSSKYDDEGSVDSYKSSKDTTTTTSGSSSSKDKSYDYLKDDEDDSSSSSSSYKSSSSKSKASSSDDTDEKSFGYKSTEGKSPSYDSKDSSSYGSKDSSSSSYSDKSKDKVSTYDSKDSSSYGSKDTTYDKSSKDSTSYSDKSKDTTSSYGSSKDKDSDYGSKDTTYGSKDTGSYGSSKDKVSTYDSKDSSSYGSKDSSSSYDKSSKDSSSSSDYTSKDSSSYGSKDTTGYDKSSKDSSSDYKSKDSGSSSSYGSSSSDKDSDYDSKDSSSSYGSKVSSYGDKSSDSTSDYKFSKDSSSDSSSSKGSSYDKSKDSGSSYDKSSKDSTSSYDKSSKDSSSGYGSKDSSSSYGSKDSSSYGSSKDSSSKDSTSDSKSSKDTSSYGDDSKDTTSDSSDEASWDLKPKAVTEQKFSPLAKRNGIPMPELDTAMSAPKGESGSELPESLKKKLSKDANNRWLDTEESETTKPDPEYVAAPPSEPPNRKPVTHEEYVENKLETEKLPSGFVDIASPSYLLRPEAIESVWYMYRITGDPEWMDKGWTMFEATMKATRTEYANSAIDDVMASSPGIRDSMESFWTAETLKYYYLLFSEPDLISLDEWVLNTEAHPFKRPTASSSMGKVSETEVDVADEDE